MMSKRLIFAIAAIFILAVVVYQGFFRKEKPTFTLAEVIRGNITQEVSETGQVKKGEEMNLSFKNTGRIEKIYVAVGEEVKAGDILAKQETTQLKIQLQEAKAALAISQAKLTKLLVGASPEEIQVAKAAVSNVEISLKNVQQNLEDVKAQAKENLSVAYEDALNVLDDSYLKIYNAFQAADSIQRTYFTVNDQESIKVRENKDKINNISTQAKSYLDIAKADPKEENIDTALSEMKKALEVASDALKIIRETCEEPSYRNIVSSANKTSLDTQRTNINTALANVINSQQTISLTKLTNETNINAAQAKVSSAEGSIIAAQDELARTLAPPRQEDRDLYQAQVTQAQAQIQLLENQIEESILKSPTEGQITKIKKKVGEMVQPMLQDVVIAILPTAPFEIESDIYEEDVVKINIGNPVDISLVALPEKIFKGKIVAIDLVQKLIEGVVYYEATIAFEEIPEGIKPGMTADVVIKTASKENVLTVSQDAIQNKEGKTIVEVLKGEKFEERKIEIGLKGSNDIVEVIFGLEEGEKVTIR